MERKECDFSSIAMSKVSPSPQVEHRSHHVYIAGWITPILAPETDVDATDDHEWRLQV